MKIKDRLLINNIFYNNTLIKIKAQLIDLQNKIKKYNTIKQLKNSEKSTNEIKFEKLKTELVNLKIKIEELSLFNGSIKQLPQDLKILQKKQNSLLKQEWLKKRWNKSKDWKVGKR